MRHNGHFSYFGSYIETHHNHDSYNFLRFLSFIQNLFMHAVSMIIVIKRCTRVFKQNSS